MGKWKELAQPDDIHTCHADCQNPACVAVRQAASGKPQAMKPTQEQVIAWAREARLAVNEPSWGYSEAYHFAGFEETFIRFATLVYEAGRKDENEACAKVCEGLRDEDGYEAWGIECAAAIRARGQS